MSTQSKLTLPQLPHSPHLTARTSHLEKLKPYSGSCTDLTQSLNNLSIRSTPSPLTTSITPPSPRECLYTRSSSQLSNSFNGSFTSLSSSSTNSLLNRQETPLSPPPNVPRPPDHPRPNGSIMRHVADTRFTHITTQVKIDGEEGDTFTQVQTVMTPVARRKFQKYKAIDAIATPNTNRKNLFLTETKSI